MTKKAVLIFDMPESCMDCMANYGCAYCTATKRKLEFATMCNKRPDWCPLIETTKGNITRARMYLNRIEYAKEDRL